MHSNVIEAYKRNLKLSQRQRDIIVGVLLGDGHLETRDSGKTYRLKIEHSIKQKDYVNWLYQELQPWVRESPRVRIVTSAFTREGGNACYGFTTYSHGALRFYGQQFYRGRIKIIPASIRKLLTPPSIAIWYLDDGSWKSNRHSTFIIHTHGYSQRELARVQQALQKFGIQARLHRQIRERGTYWRTYIVSKSAGKFRELITPTISLIPSMSYKLGNTLPKE